MTRSDIPLPPELAQCVEQLRTILARRIKLINALIAVLVGHPSSRTLRSESSAVPAGMAQALPLMLQALGSSSNTVVRLSEAPSFATRDCYSIARSIVELSVNICYLISEGPSLADRAFRHASQKAYQDLERESTIGDSTIRLVFSGKFDVASVPDLEEQLAEFTSGSGREKGWVVIDGFHAAYGFQWAQDRNKELTDSMSTLPYLGGTKSAL